jgi:hypothetical protein
VGEVVTTSADRYKLFEATNRCVSTTVTYVKKSLAFMYAHPKHIPISSGYWDLLEISIDAATEITQNLPDDFFETTKSDDPFGILAANGLERDFYNQSDEPLANARKLVAAIEARRAGTKTMRRIEQLENTVGRTEAETASYRAKAEELRSRL